MSRLSNIMVRNAVASLLFFAVVGLQLWDGLSYHLRTYSSIALLLIFAFVIPLRASFRYVLAKLGIIRGETQDDA